MDTVNLSDITANTPSQTEDMRWYALRDLKRVNSKTPAYKDLSERGIKVFTPMRWVVKMIKGKRKRLMQPALSDLLFAYSDRTTLDPIIQTIPTLQYRYARGGYCVPIVIRDSEMETFIKATESATDPKYYNCDEINTLSIGKTIRILSGPMIGLEAKIVNVRGARKKRILVSIPNLIAAVVEVDNQNIEVID